ncbi:MAG: BMC domain-containing protein, partial [Thermoleophilia bacterium]
MTPRKKEGSAADAAELGTTEDAKAPPEKPAERATERKGMEHQLIALGMVETRGLVASIVAADAMVKA